jgi:hypothetical protein
MEFINNFSVFFNIIWPILCAIPTIYGFIKKRIEKQKEINNNQMKGSPNNNTTGNNATSRKIRNYSIISYIGLAGLIIWGIWVTINIFNITSQSKDQLISPNVESISNPNLEITVTTAGKILEKSSTTSMVGNQTIQVTAMPMPDISEIQYSINGEKTQRISGPVATITLNDKFINVEKAELRICAVANDGTPSNIATYYFNVTDKPVVYAVIDNNILKGKTADITKEQKLEIIAECPSGIAEIQYSINKEETQRAYSSKTTITLPDEYKNSEKVELIICAVANNGTVSDIDTYYFTMTDKTVNIINKPKMDVIIDNKTLIPGETVDITNTQEIKIIAEHSSGISEIQYSIAGNNTQRISDSTAIITSKDYLKTGQTMTIVICAISNDGTISNIDTYYFNVK